MDEHVLGAMHLVEQEWNLCFYVEDAVSICTAPGQQLLQVPPKAPEGIHMSQAIYSLPAYQQGV